jgi:hypothetical protein
MKNNNIKNNFQYCTIVFSLLFIVISNKCYSQYIEVYNPEIKSEYFDCRHCESGYYLENVKVTCKNCIDWANSYREIRGCDICKNKKYTIKQKKQFCFSCNGKGIKRNTYYTQEGIEKRENEKQRNQLAEELRKKEEEKKVAEAKIKEQRLVSNSKIIIVSEGKSKKKIRVLTTDMNSDKLYTCNEADNYANNLGWRLPDVDELEAILNNNVDFPNLDRRLYAFFTQSYIDKNYAINPCPSSDYKRRIMLEFYNNKTGTVECQCGCTCKGKVIVVKDHINDFSNLLDQDNNHTERPIPEQNIITTETVNNNNDDNNLDDAINKLTLESKTKVFTVSEFSNLLLGKVNLHHSGIENIYNNNDGNNIKQTPIRITGYIVKDKNTGNYYLSESSKPSKSTIHNDAFSLKFHSNSTVSKCSLTEVSSKNLVRNKITISCFISKLTKTIDIEMWELESINSNTHCLENSETFEK